MNESRLEASLVAPNVELTDTRGETTLHMCCRSPGIMMGRGRGRTEDLTKKTSKVTGRVELLRCVPSYRARRRPRDWLVRIVPLYPSSMFKLLLDWYPELSLTAPFESYPRLLMSSSWFPVYVPVYRAPAVILFMSELGQWCADRLLEALSRHQ